MDAGTPDRRRLELYVRSLSAADAPADDQARRVRALADEGRVADASVLVWGQEVGLSTAALRTRLGKAILDRIGTFRAWAAERDASMGPFFTARTVTGTVTGESYSTLRLPVSCLAEYVGEELVHVAPHRDASRTVTVADRLRVLEPPAAEDRPLQDPVPL